MNTPKIFQVNYQTDYSTGCVRVYVRNFFGNTNLKIVDTFLKFARKHCTSKQQAALLRDLEEEMLISRGKRRERMEKCIRKIKSQSW